MARYSENPDAHLIYSAAFQFRDHCLLANGSLLTNHLDLWSADNLQSLHAAFVATPDEGDRTFMEKFEDQIKPTGPVVCCLAAELLAVYFLFPSNVGKNRKTRLVNEVLGWGGQSLSADGSVARAFSGGIGSGGQGYNTRRPFEIAFLIEFAIAWKGLSDEAKLEAAVDPWGFMNIVDEVEGADTKQLRHMLLHLLFPDTFERIASREHKRRVALAFASLISNDPSEEVDRSLFAIREALTPLVVTDVLDFYHHPLVEVWNVSGGSEEAGAPMDALRHKKQIILFGPPGTGKTYGASLIADRLVRSALLTKHGAKGYFNKAASGELEKEIAAKIHRLQLHPAYSYEDFVRGLHIAGSGATEYRKGYLPKLVEQMGSDDLDVPHVLILDEINRTDLSRMLGECFSLLENRNQTIELPGHDSAGDPLTLKIPQNLYFIGTMNLIDQSVEQMDFALRRRFLWVLCLFDGEALVQAAQSIWDRDSCRIPWERVEADFVRLASAAEALNAEIRDSPLLGSQYEIGHTYLLDAVSFLKHDLGPRPQHFLWNKKGKGKRPIEQTWELSLSPLIREYLSGLESKGAESELKRLKQVFVNVPPELE